MKVTRANYFDYVSKNGLPDDKELRDGDELVRILTDGGTSWARVDGDANMSEMVNNHIAIFNQVKPSKKVDLKKFRASASKVGKTAKGGKKTSHKASSKRHARTPVASQSEPEITPTAAKKKAAKRAPQGQGVLSFGRAKAKKGATAKAAGLARRLKRAVTTSKPAEAIKSVLPAAKKSVAAKGVATQAKRVAPPVDKGALSKAQKLQEKRGVSGMRDAMLTNNDRLVATDENLKRWTNDPGDYDMIGVDAAGRNDATVGLKRVKKASSTKATKTTKTAGTKPAKTAKKASSKKATKTAKSTGKQAPTSKAKSAAPVASKPTRKGAAKVNADGSPRVGMFARIFGRKTVGKPVSDKPISVKDKADLKGKNFIKEVDALAKQIHDKSATGTYKKVPQYGISRAKAKQRAFETLGKVRQGKVKNVKIKK